jgi:hypothetical protein
MDGFPPVCCPWSRHRAGYPVTRRTEQEDEYGEDAALSDRWHHRFGTSTLAAGTRISVRLANLLGSGVNPGLGRCGEIMPGGFNPRGG